MRRTLAALWAALATVVVLALSISGAQAHSAVPTAGTGHKVMVILFENHSRTQAMAGMPTLVSYANRFGQATGYAGVRHPSLPNYLAIFGGSTFGVTTDCNVGAASCVPAAPSIFGQTLAAGETARAYQESMNGTCELVKDGKYAPKHGPWPYWTDTTERAGCTANDVPMGTTTSGNLASDVAAGNLPVTGEMTPNLCNDAHNCALSVADKWLKGWLPVLMSGPDYTSGNLTIVVTFDEDGGTTANNVAFVVIDPRLDGTGTIITGTFKHYSLARWLEDNAGVATLRNAATAPDLRAAFGLG